MAASKLNARLCLAFSTTEDTLDLRGEAWLWSSLRERLPPLPEGQVQQVIVDDLLGSGHDADGNRYEMTDGAGLIAHNLAKYIP
jgi:hypothetical protein